MKPMQRIEVGRAWWRPGSGSGSSLALGFALAVGAALLGAGMASAQAPAPGQVPGEQIEAWLKADGMPVAGRFLSNGCHFMALGAGDARVQVIRCPEVAQTLTVRGSVRVAGHQFCSKFSYPDGQVVDRCQDLFLVGENRYELRLPNGQVSTVFHRLLP